jgi:isochorismate synthase
MKTVSSVVSGSVKEIRDSVIDFALDQKYSIAAWRLPNQDKVNLLLSSQVKLADELEIEECAPGFAFAPFDPSRQKYFFEANHLFEISLDEIKELTRGQLLEQVSKERKQKRSLNFFLGVPNNKASNHSPLLELIKKSIEAVESGSFEKVVPSAQKMIPINDQFNLLDAFDELIKNYPSAMVSLVSDQNIGTWLGASPELLVSTDSHGIFRTVALAGTQVYDTDMPLRSISWTQKEIEEQALVERYIISCFKKIRVREFDEHGPKTVAAGNLVHLKSYFEVDMNAVNFPLLGSVMLKLLHPTSAVCGMPMAPSFKFLLDNENYDREFYAGFLGPVNIEEECHIFVNLRCLKWCGDSLNLYAGAGVTLGSEAEMEVKEIEMKMQTVMRVLGLGEEIK